MNKLNHTIRIRRHVLRDIMASIVGGALIVALVQKSWIAGILGVVVGAALFVEEKADIEEEEQ